MKNIFKIFIFYLILLSNKYTLALQEENFCINYSAGIGDFEIASSLFSSEIEKLLTEGREANINFTPAGWVLSGDLESANLKYFIDRKTPTPDSNNSSFFLEVNNFTFNKSYSLSFRNSLWTSPRYISTETRSYYPQPGDNLLVKFYYRLDKKINTNLTFRIEALYHIRTNAGLREYSYNLISRNLQENIGNFNLIEVSSTIPYPNQVTSTAESLSRLIINFSFNFINTSSPREIKFWLDKLQIYSYRNGNCLILPSQRESILNFFEVFEYTSDWDLLSNQDFIKLYKDNIKLTNSFRDIYLINKKLNPLNFNYTYTISPTTIHKYRKYNSNIADKYSTRKLLSEILQHFEDLQIPTTTDVPPYSRNHPAYRLHTNARYPDYIAIRTDTENLYDYPYGGIRYMIGISNLKPLYIDYLKKFLFEMETTLFGKSFLSPKYYFIDNFNAGGGTAARSSDYRSNIYLWYKTAYKDLFPLRKYLFNLGYHGLSDNPRDALRKFNGGGYMNEGWLYNPERFYYPNSSTIIHNLFSSVINNQDLEVIMLIGAYPYNSTSPSRNCTDSEPIIRSLVSSFYLINNPNVYFALVPGGITSEGYEIPKYSFPQCYPDSMFLNLGEYSTVNNINEMIIGTTSDDFYVYSRDYSNGWVIFNSSPNNSYILRINWQNRNHQRYIEYFTRREYNSSSDSTIEIPPKSGVILVNIDSNNQSGIYLNQEFNNH